MILIPQPYTNLLTHFLNNSFTVENEEQIFLRKKLDDKNEIYELQSPSSFSYCHKSNILTLTNKIFSFTDSPIIFITKKFLVKETQSKVIYTPKSTCFSKKSKFKIMDSPNNRITISSVNFNETEATLIHSDDSMMTYLINELMSNFPVAIKSDKNGYEIELFDVLTKSRIINQGNSS